MTTPEYPEQIYQLIDQLRELQEMPNAPLTDNVQNLHQLFRYISLLEIIDNRAQITNAAPILACLPPVSEEEATLSCIEEFLDRFVDICAGEYIHNRATRNSQWDRWERFAVTSCAERLVQYGFIRESEAPFLFNHVPHENRVMGRWVEQWRAGTMPESNVREGNEEFLGVRASYGDELEEDSCSEVDSEFDEFDRFPGTWWVDPEAGDEEMFFSTRPGVESENRDGLSDDYSNESSVMNREIRQAFAQAAFPSEDEYSSSDERRGFDNYSEDEYDSEYDSEDEEEDDNSEAGFSLL